MNEMEFFSLAPELTQFEETQCDLDLEDYEHLEIHSGDGTGSKRVAA